MTTPQRHELTAEQRDELFAVYKTVTGLHHLSFEECIANRVYLICLWNVNRARQKARARTAAAAQHFQLEP